MKGLALAVLCVLLAPLAVPYLAVDEERGIVLSAGFIDHEGRIGDFRLTDGSTRTSIFRRPHSFVFLEAFKIKEGRIEQVESCS